MMKIQRYKDNTVIHHNDGNHTTLMDDNTGSMSYTAKNGMYMFWHLTEEEVKSLRYSLEMETDLQKKIDKIEQKIPSDEGMQDREFLMPYINDSSIKDKIRNSHKEATEKALGEMLRSIQGEKGRPEAGN